MVLKRNTLELRKTINRKIKHIERLLEMASKEDYLSEDRRELLSQVAVELRVLFCYSGGKPLIETALLEKELMFPFNNSFPYNGLNGFPLVVCHLENGISTFHSQTRMKGKVPRTIIPYICWIYEIVVDLNLEGWPPLSRNDVIKMIAEEVIYSYKKLNKLYLEKNWIWNTSLRCLISLMPRIRDLSFRK